MQDIIKHYYTKNGKLYRKSDGREMGWESHGYLIFDHKRKKYRVHRAIFLLHYGYLPKLIDHIDRNKLNNYPDNLRESNKRLNAFNTGVRKDNKSGYAGIHFNDNANKWAASIYIHGKKKHLGYYKLLDEAVTARKAEEAKINYSEIH